MAKRKLPGLMAVEEYVAPKRSDNNPDGPYPKPDYDLNAYQRKEGRICFPCNLGETESPNKTGGVNMVTANGISSSRGQGLNNQFNWGDRGTDGAWNDSDGEWSGGNLSGM